jgi:hypothetical protein
MPDANNLVPLVASARFSVRAAAGLMLAAAIFAVSPARAQTTEPVVVRTVTQDDQVRIEETRVRGAVQRIVVEQKVGGSYEITPPSATTDPSRSPTPRGGERRWRLFSF